MAVTAVGGELTVVGGTSPSLGGGSGIHVVGANSGVYNLPFGTTSFNHTLPAGNVGDVIIFLCCATVGQVTSTGFTMDVSGSYPTYENLGWMVATQEEYPDHFFDTSTDSEFGVVVVRVANAATPYTRYNYGGNNIGQFTMTQSVDTPAVCLDWIAMKDTGQNLSEPSLQQGSGTKLASAAAGARVAAYDMGEGGPFASSTYQDSSGILDMKGYRIILTQA